MMLDVRRHLPRNIAPRRFKSVVITALSNVIGNGRWFDGYIQNLVAVPAAPSGLPSTRTPSGGSR